MPKKFKGENSKAAEAKARKTAQKEAEDQRKQQQLEDEYWKDDDKHLVKKQQRKDEKEKKRVEQLERKKEVALLAEQEVAAIKPVKQPVVAKVTRADIERHQQQVEAAAVTQIENTPVTEQPLEENINRLVVDGDEARSVEAAIQLLSATEEEVDLHPEKRMKAAYLAFEERNLPLLKAENPNLRLSQLKQMLKKDWAKSPENPLNQRLLKSQ